MKEYYKELVIDGVDNVLFLDICKPLRRGKIVAFPAFAKISLATSRALGVSKLPISSKGKEKIKEGPN